MLAVMNRAIEMKTKHHTKTTHTTTTTTQTTNNNKKEKGNNFFFLYCNAMKREKTLSVFLINHHSKTKYI
jgi:hypothetical protein|tara:strand:+ start:538 stop:747 length:210 start_codon:yes stop_codon:yes gene_type:complete